jgi:hypothetical protein
MPCLVLLIALVAAQLTTPTDVNQRAVQGASKVEGSIPSELAEKLSKARRVFVESFGESPVSKTLQAMIIDAVRTSGRFIVTENHEKADLILKGAALEKTSQEMHALGSSTAVAGAAGGSNASVSATPGYTSGSSQSGFRAAAAETADAQVSTESVHDARAAVRLVSLDGDVVWSTTQESKGAKYKSATADVADKILKQLVRDVDKLKNQ